MKVMVMVKASKDSEAGAMPTTELLAAMGKFNEELAAAGIMLSADGLRAQFERGRGFIFSDTQRTVIDGPFTETKELIAGFWIWKVKSMQEAIDWVKKCPNPMKVDSDIEIRPFFSVEDFGAELTPELRERGSATRARTFGLNKPVFHAGPELTIAGISRHYTAESRVGIPGHWGEFANRDLKGGAYFGVCYNSKPDCSFDYLTGVEVTASTSVPKDFTTMKIDARRYAVFAHTGHVSALPKTIDTIWSKWVPESNFKIAGGAPCLERYSADFNDKTGLGGMEIWIPLES